jgi:hypothetical protein
MFLSHPTFLERWQDPWSHVRGVLSQHVVRPGAVVLRQPVLVVHVVIVLNGLDVQSVSARRVMPEQPQHRLERIEDVLLFIFLLSFSTRCIHYSYSIIAPVAKCTVTHPERETAWRVAFLGRVEISSSATYRFVLSMLHW